MEANTQQAIQGLEVRTQQAIQELEAKTQLLGSHSQSIAKLEAQIGQLATTLNRREEGKLPSQPMENPRGQYAMDGSHTNDTFIEQAKAVITVRSGRSVETRPEGEKENEKELVPNPTSSGVEKVNEPERDSPHSSSTPTNPVVEAPPYVPKAPFPTRLTSTSPLGKKGANIEQMMEVFKQVKINLPLLDAIKQIPSYAKFLKDLCTFQRKTRHHVSNKVFLTEQVSSIARSVTPHKLKDPGTPVISCVIENHFIDRALLDLGASVNLMPYSVYEQLGLGELKPTAVTLQLADRSLKVPRGVLEDVLVKVDNFYYPADFIVLDTEPVPNNRNQTPVILGRPFLATANANIQCRTGAMDVSFGNMRLTLNVYKGYQSPHEEDNCFMVNVLDDSGGETISCNRVDDRVDEHSFSSGLDFDGFMKRLKSFFEFIHLLAAPPWIVWSKLLPMDLRGPLFFLIDSPLRLELRQSPLVREHSFQEPDKTLPMIDAHEHY